MANLYLIHKQSSAEALALAQEDKEALVVLLQDGVFLDVSGFNKTQVYAIKWDVDIRGLNQRTPSTVKLISYHDLVDLIVANKVVNLT
ncbi:MAG: DsrH/TusB family sulfur metabolism protein [Dehalococcoidia bacterium]|nr:DsrH/TusB family sulfur metabolism protein [Dehalococcoidia bacterium]